MAGALRETPSGPVWASQRAYLNECKTNTARRTGDKKNGVEPVKWRTNAPRHSFGSYRLAELQDAAKTAFEMGNSPSMIHRYYWKMTAPEDASRYFNVMPCAPENVIPVGAVRAAG